VCCQDGRLLVHDIMKHEQIAELILPAGYEYTASQPGVCGTVDSGRTLFVIGSLCLLRRFHEYLFENLRFIGRR
jgi:hypothetical protein